MTERYGPAVQAHPSSARPTLAIVLGSVPLLLLSVSEVGFVAGGWSRAFHDALFYVAAVGLLVVLAGVNVLVLRRVKRQGTPAIRAGGAVAKVAWAGWGLFASAVAFLIPGAGFLVGAALLTFNDCIRPDDGFCGLGTAIGVFFCGLAAAACGLLGTILWAGARWHVQRRSGETPSDAARAPEIMSS